MGVGFLTLSHLLLGMYYNWNRSGMVVIPYLIFAAAIYYYIPNDVSSKVATDGKGHRARI